MEAAVVQVGEQLGGASALVHPLGILSMAAWISAHDALSPRQLDDLLFDTRAAPGVRMAIGELAPGMMGFRQSYNEAAEARRVAELAGRPALSPATRTSRRRRFATADLEQARIFVQRELHGPTGMDDLTRRSTATLRTYLDERSSRSRTAKRLGIHENTVTYRINQAEETLGRGVDQRTLELRVALVLARLVRDQAN